MDEKPGNLVLAVALISMLGCTGTTRNEPDEPTASPVLTALEKPIDVKVVEEFLVDVLDSIAKEQGIPCELNVRQRRTRPLLR
jgi:hypothetical protein